MQYRHCKFQSAKKKVLLAIKSPTIFHQQQREHLLRIDEIFMSKLFFISFLALEMTTFSLMQVEDKMVFESLKECGCRGR